MVLVATNAVLDPEACEEMLAILRRQHQTDQITRRLSDFDGYLEQGVAPLMWVASKSGAIRGTRNDVALVESRGSPLRHRHDEPRLRRPPVLRG